MIKVCSRLFLLVAIFFIAYTQLVKGKHQPRQDCQSKCGNFTIEYPFGISTGCHYPGDTNFKITCKKDKPNVRRNIEVKTFDHSGQLRALLNRSTVCYDEEANIEFNSYRLRLDNLSLSPNNKFTVVGCNAWGLLRTFGVQNHSTGCLSLCDSPPAPNSKCNGAGCCRTDVSIPLDSNRLQTGPDRFENMTSVHEFNPCTYAFLVEDGMFNFSSTEDLKNLRGVKQFPVVLDWSIGSQTCEQAGSRNICGENSTCFDSTRGKGYNCKCLDGFEGNPYTSDGCQDINECTTTSSIHKHNCSDPKTCRNRDGGFDCKCRSGYRLDTTTMSCKRKDFGWAMILLVTTIVFLVILLGVSFIQHRLRRRKDTELRQKFFEKNGGGMLIQRLSGAGPSNADVKIFTEEGMKEATNGYDESRILGQGGQGTVYKGILPDNSVVAIKKARLGDRSQVEQFINEVLVLSQINHRNVVKLLGCCLETEVPLLVYEFINSGTLFDHLHGSLFDSSLTWEHRLRIAVEVAGTLAYLHSSASIPIIHRDVKTANILLDDNLTAKVADFGASRLIPMDQEQLTTMVQGTLGYLDPEYYNTGLLNEKSDVYSFGVVLMELLSGQKALCFERLETSKHLVSYFLSSMKENKLHEIIDGQVMNEYNQREIQEAARIALECTRLMGEERPRMKDVAAELEALRAKTTKHKWSDQFPKEVEHLLGVQILSAQGDTSSTGYDSIKNVAILDIEAGR
ncbi:PREDICTED: wall-associated receptor kinase 5-like isoform X1 [Camelina sativa]|uniref:Wall-associated receptor kinase 5-like isoform X1 n=1 Tax=Camelina sativa TaxID=90675 RepID=A0ABM1QVF7_CAMSA|nr:PREDICTED: wall-associated receptor kinase 5-like isoform X1 [Camelina sativa]